MLLFVILPITVLKNAVRIVTLSLLAIHVDRSFLTGSLHHDGGIVFFVLALAMMTPVFVVMYRSESSQRGRRRRTPMSAPMANGSAA